jgi:hypothetical protein
MAMDLDDVTDLLEKVRSVSGIGTEMNGKDGSIEPNSLDGNTARNREAEGHADVAEPPSALPHGTAA